MYLFYWRVRIIHTYTQSNTQDRERDIEPKLGCLEAMSYSQVSQVTSGVKGLQPSSNLFLGYQ